MENVHLKSLFCVRLVRQKRRLCKCQAIRTKAKKIPTNYHGYDFGVLKVLRLKKREETKQKATKRKS